MAHSKPTSAIRILVGALLFALLTVSAQARTLSYALADPPTNTRLHQALEWWVDSIESCTDGSIKIKVYPQGSLVKLKDEVRALSAGVADIGYVVPAYAKPVLPLWYLASTGIGPGDPYVTVEAWQQVREQYPAIRKEEEKANLKYMTHFSLGPTVLISTDHPYLTPDDFKGDKVRLASRYARAAKINGWNVTPVNLSFPEVYTAMERGTIDGAVSYLPQTKQFKQNEVAKYLVEPNLGQQSDPIFMNLGTWNSLSSAQQGCFNTMNKKFTTRMERAIIDDTNADRKILESDDDYPLKITQLNDDQRAAWIKGLKDAEQVNIDRAKKRDPKAADVYQAYRKNMQAMQDNMHDNGYPWGKEESASD